MLVAEEILQRVWKPFRLVHLGAGNFAASPDNRVAGTDQDLRAPVDRADAILEFADETIVQAIELLFLGLAEIEIGKQPPSGDRKIADKGLFDPAEPADELRRQPARNAVGQQEIDVFVLENLKNLSLDRHAPVKTSS